MNNDWITEKAYNAAVQRIAQLETQLADAQKTIADFKKLNHSQGAIIYEKASQLSVLRDAIVEFRRHAHYPHGGTDYPDSVSDEKKLAFIAASVHIDNLISRIPNDYLHRSEVEPLVKALEAAYLGEASVADLVSALEHWQQIKDAKGWKQ